MLDSAVGPDAMRESAGEVAHGELAPPIISSSNGVSKTTQSQSSAEAIDRPQVADVIRDNHKDQPAATFDLSALKAELPKAFIERKMAQPGSKLQKMRSSASIAAPADNADSQSNSVMGPSESKTASDVILSPKEGAIAVSQEPVSANVASVDPDQNVPAGKQRKKREKAKAAPLPLVELHKRNEEYLSEIEGTLNQFDMDFAHKDTLGARCLQLQRTLTLLIRFKDVFRQRGQDMHLTRLSEEDELLSRYGSDRQLLEMASRLGYVSLRANKEGYEFTPTSKGQALIAPRKASVPLDRGPSPELKRQLDDIYKGLRPTAESDRIRANIVKDVQFYLDRFFQQSALHVEQFGSSGNTLYTPRSDLDLCCIYKIVPPHSFVSVRMIANSLRRAHFASHVSCIDHAKIPVVKFTHRQTDLQVDISIENAIAIENTLLIRTYAEMDPRFQMLAFPIKTWCKRRCISVPSEGTLSSYSWTLMLVHYLQNCSPPVLPNLQEKTDRNRDTMAEYVHAHMGQMILCSYDARPSFVSKNKASVGTLLLGFFEYYAHRFNFRGEVVTISRPSSKRPLRKEHKAKEKTCGSPSDWLGKRICIEDPFISTRNTGVGCNPALADWTESEILRAFQILDSGGSFADIVEFSIP